MSRLSVASLPRRALAAIVAFLIAAVVVSVAIVLSMNQAHDKPVAAHPAADSTSQCIRQRSALACKSAVPAATTHPSVSPSPTQPAGVWPDGVPASQVGSLVLNDSAADLWNAWNHSALAGSDCDSPGAITLSGSVLDLTTNGTLGNCAEVTSEATYRYGIFEARIWAQAGPGGMFANWPGFWLVGQDWPVGGEIDAFEGLHGYDSTSFHYGTTNSYFTMRDSALAPGWNVVDVVWMPQKLAVYYNGQKFVEWDSSAITSQPMTVIFDNTTGTHGYTTNEPSTLAVDYLRIWTAA